MTINRVHRRLAADFRREFLRAHGLERPLVLNGFEVGDRVQVIQDEDCPEYVGLHGTVVELRPGLVARVGETSPRETVIVALDNGADGGYPDGFDSDQLVPAFSVKAA